MRFLLWELQARSSGKKQDWDIPSASFRDGREICHPIALQIYSPRRKGVCVYLEEGSFASWQLNPLKGIPGGSAFACAEFGSSCCLLDSVGWGWDMEGEEQIPPGSGSMSFPCKAVAVQNGISWPLRAALLQHFVCVCVLVPRE